MKIGSLTLANPVILAPLAGIGNPPFRQLAKEAGCGLVCAEMVSANGLVRQARRTLAMLASRPEEKPLSLQIFGTQPAVMAEAARIVEASGADILDINFGCAVRKVVKTGAGVALMRDPAGAEKLLLAVRRAIRIPLTIKLRSGWDASGEQALALARIAEDCGVDAVALHPRTAAQGFAGRADWGLIARLKGALAIPVIGNGDIASADDALEMLARTGCDGVMIGRAAIGNPWLFSQTLERLAGRPPTPVDGAGRFAAMRVFLAASVAHCGEQVACRTMRSRLGWFVRGLPESARFREAIKELESQAQALELLERYAERLGSV
jgi:nifR3 family TIM-barrel protein